MLELRDLSVKELTFLSEEAAKACAHRLTQIAQAADPSDGVLQNLLGELAHEASPIPPFLEEGGEAGSLAPERPLASSKVKDFVRGSLNSLSKRFGEGRLDRDIALFFAESIEEEVSRFYLKLSQHAGHHPIRSRLFDLSERERGKLRHLREVVL